MAEKRLIWSAAVSQTCWRAKVLTTYLKCGGIINWLCSASIKSSCASNRRKLSQPRCIEEIYRPKYQCPTERWILPCEYVPPTSEFMANIESLCEAMLSTALPATLELRLRMKQAETEVKKWRADAFEYRRRASVRLPISFGPNTRRRPTDAQQWLATRMCTPTLTSGEVSNVIKQIGLICCLAVNDSILTSHHSILPRTI